MRISKTKEITWVTCVGVLLNKFPLSSGNCFSVLTEDNKQYRIVNFCFENIEELIKRGICHPFQIGILSDRVAVLLDSRIPDSWYQEHYCEACCPDSLLPHGQQMRHIRQEERGERVVKGNCIFTDFSKAPKIPDTPLNIMERGYRSPLHK
jgi:hypothetical protein